MPIGHRQAEIGGMLEANTTSHITVILHGKLFSITFRGGQRFPRQHPKWHPIPYIVHYFRPEPYGSLFPIIVHYFRPEPYGTLFHI